jgi:aspartate dehydrogenase
VALQDVRGTSGLRKSTRVGVIGYGAIGAPVIEALRDGRIPGCKLSGILTRSKPQGNLERYSASSLFDLIERSDLVVEAAGHGALATLGPDVIESGKDLLVLSVGALVDDELFAKLTQEGGGRLLISTGAVGGLDTLLAAMLMHPLDSVSLTSRKPAQVLVREWMSEDLQDRLEAGITEIEAFSGPAREAVGLFPESANIAATLALATVGWDRLHVRMVGVPQAGDVEHRVSAAGRAGSYEFVFRNRPADGNPRTSAITPFSVIRALRRLRANTVVGI